MFCSGKIKFGDHDIVVPSVVNAEYTEGVGTAFIDSHVTALLSFFKYLSPEPEYVGNGDSHSTAVSPEFTIKNSSAWPVLEGNPIAADTSDQARPSVLVESTVSILPLLPAFAGNSVGVVFHFSVDPLVCRNLPTCPV